MVGRMNDRRSISAFCPYYVVLACFGAAACNGNESESSTSVNRSRIVNGTEVPSPAQTGLVRLSNNGGLASGLLLSNQWALTAAHVIPQTECRAKLPSEAANGNTRRQCRYTPSNFSVQLGNASSPGETQPVNRISVHPRFTYALMRGDTKYPNVDVALVHTPAFSGTFAAPTFPSAAGQSSSMVAGTKLYCYGFGRNTLADQPSDPLNGFGTARWGATRVTGYASENIDITNDPDTSSITITGDSGGPCTLRNPASDTAALSVIEGVDSSGNGTDTRLAASGYFGKWLGNVMQSVEDMNYDWDGDGKPDALFWIVEGANLVLYFQKDGGPNDKVATWASLPVSSLGDLTTFHSAVGDFNNDTIPDVVAVTATVSVYKTGPSTSGGSPGTGTAPVKPGTYTFIYASDVDGSTPDDIVARTPEGVNWYYFGVPPDGTSGWRPTSFEARAFARPDIDKNGISDLAVIGRIASDPGKVEIRYYKDNGEIKVGDTQSDTFITLDTANPYMVAGDFNGDGYGDVAVSLYTKEWETTAYKYYQNIWYYAANTFGSVVFVGKPMHELLDLTKPGTLLQDLEVTDFKPQDSAQDLIAIRADESGTLYRGRTGSYSSTSAGVASAASTPAGGLPTVSAKDGRLLTLTGKGRSTYSAPYSEFLLSSDSPNASIQIYDANSVGGQDSVDSVIDTCFQVWDDPCGDGMGSCGLGAPVLLTDSVTKGSSTIDTVWKTIYGGTQTARVGLNSRYNYRIVAYLSTSGSCSLERSAAIEEAKKSAVGGWNGFKVRGSGYLSYQYGELQVIASTLNANFANFMTEVPDWLRESRYPGSFNFYFNVSDAVSLSETDPNDANIRLAEADADYLKDQDAPGVAQGANDTINFTLTAPSGTAVILDRTNEQGNVTESIGNTQVTDPSGNFDSSGSPADVERYKVREADEVPGLWRWTWNNVWAQNNIHLYSPLASPVAHEMLGAPVTPPPLTSALSLEEWRASSISSSLLPLTLGSVDASGNRQGESLLLTTPAEVTALLSSLPTNLWQQLAVAKLNLKRAAAGGEKLEEALLRGGRLSIHSIVNEADESLRGPRKLIPPASIDRAFKLLRGLNRGQVTYYRPGTPVPVNPGLDTDGDGFLGVEDNCPTVYNPSQSDGNADGVGDACSVVPQLRCVLRTASGYKAYLGYDNSLEFRSLPVGAQNRFSPGLEDRGQPREFLQGRLQVALPVEFAAGQSLVWTLDGQQLVINASGPACTGKELFDVPGFGSLALYGIEEVLVRNTATVEAENAAAGILSGNYYEVAAAARVPESWAAGNAKADSNAVINGNLVLGGTVSPQTGVHVSGQIIQNAYVPRQILDIAYSFPTASGDLFVEQAGRVLVPGAYPRTTVRGNLRLSSGVYSFSELVLEPQGTITLDQSNGPIAIYVQLGLTIRGPIVTTNGAFPDLFLGYLGTNDSIIEYGLRGGLLAPNAKVVLGSLGGVHEGRFFAKRIEVRAGTTVRLKR